MPNYVYECKGGCGQRFERQERMSDERLKTCPECGGPANQVICIPTIVQSRPSRGVRALPPGEYAVALGPDGVRLVPADTPGVARGFRRIAERRIESE